MLIDTPVVFVSSVNSVFVDGAVSGIAFACCDLSGVGKIGVLLVINSLLFCSAWNFSSFTYGLIYIKISIIKYNMHVFYLFWSKEWLWWCMYNTNTVFWLRDFCFTHDYVRLFGVFLCAHNQKMTYKNENWIFRCFFCSCLTCTNSHMDDTL